MEPEVQNPLAVLFRLEPIDDLAAKIVDHQFNRRLRSVRPSHSGLHNGHPGLDIGRVQSKVEDGVTLVTLGRQGDVYIDDASVARIQCAFEVNSTSNVVMFYDKSHNASSQVHVYQGYEGTVPVVPFRDGRPRKVYVSSKVNRVIGMCGPDRAKIRFLLVWREDADAALVSRAQKGGDTLPDCAKTAEEPESSSDMVGQALGSEKLIRYVKLDYLGAGSYGAVDKVVNVDTGQLMALKVLQRQANQSLWEKTKREASILGGIKHTHIVDFIWAQNWDSLEAELFFGLKDGSLDSLLQTMRNTTVLSPITCENLVDSVCDQMLQALDYLACNDIIHRDVKPANILYVCKDGVLTFQLSDFGLGNYASVAKTPDSGTKLFMSPEVYYGGPQSAKADIWSLYVTLLWVFDLEHFCTRCHFFKTYQDIQNGICAMASLPRLSAIRKMAEVDAGRRASAAQMLCHLYGGRGLTTPRDRVPPFAAITSLETVPTPSVLTQHGAPGASTNSVSMPDAPAAEPAGPSE